MIFNVIHANQQAHTGCGRIDGQIRRRDAFYFSHDPGRLTTAYAIMPVGVVAGKAMTDGA